MHLLQAIFALAASIRLAHAAGPFPDGIVFMATRFDNGTIVYDSLSDPSLERVVTQEDVKRSMSQPLHAPRSAKFGKRFTDCWGYQLDASSVDSAHIGLANWAGLGKEVVTTPTATTYVAITYGGVKAYYCVNARNSRGNCDRDDVEYAFLKMDESCRRYEASDFRWDGSVELVGKARNSDLLCLG
jgi:hypothetical protein